MNATDSQAYARIADEAANWLEKIERTISPEEGQALRAWLRTTPHREAIVERCKRWHGPEILAVLGEIIPVETFAERVERNYGRMVLAVLLGVSAVGTMTVMFTASRVFSRESDHEYALRAEATLQTDVGDQETVELPDGSLIMLNTASRARIVYRPRNRDVALLAGEAMFDVKFDPARPFLVSAGARLFEVQEGDARFNLRRLADDKLELTVATGRVVALASRVPSAVPPALLRARVTYGAHLFGASEGGTLGVGWQSPWTLASKEIDRRIAWQSGRMIFDGEYLEDALHELERYTTARFVLAEDELGAVRITGVFKLGDVEGMRRYLQDDLGIGTRLSESGTIILSRMNEAEAYLDCLSNDSCRRLNDGVHVTL